LEAFRTADRRDGHELHGQGTTGAGAGGLRQGGGRRRSGAELSHERATARGASLERRREAREACELDHTR
jgi:hypothetical protein